MKTSISILGLLALFVFTFSSCSGNKSPEKDTASSEEKKVKAEKEIAQNPYAGTYSFGDDIEKGAVGEIVIYPITKNSAIFHLDVNRGAPSYNSGSLLGEINIDENGAAVFKSKDEYIDCVLNFQFSESGLKISTDEKQDNCGFGHAVYADHDYKLSEKSIPKYYLSGEGDTTYFESLIEH